MDDDRGRCTHECPVSRINPASSLAFPRDTTGREPHSETVRRRCVVTARNRGDHAGIPISGWGRVVPSHRASLRDRGQARPSHPAT